MAYDLTVNATYNENCEYKKSTVEKTLPIIGEPQSVTLLLPSENVSSTTIGEDYILTVKCVLTTNNSIPVRSGYITINDLPTKCYIDNDGRATIKYTPLKIGTENITIRYNSTENIFQSTEITETITVNKIGTRTKIIEYPETIADYEESVTIKAKVTTEDNTEITYGRVTFLHYLEYNVGNEENRIEKIIGNPVYLNQYGEATITYVPMQTYEDDIAEDIEWEDKYVEYIKAVYNYSKNATDNSDENVQWNYYGESDDIGCIYIRRPNTVIIQGYKKDGITPLEINDYRECTDEDTVVLKVSIITEEGEEISFSQDDKILLEVKTLQGSTSTHESIYAQYNINTQTFDVNMAIEPGLYDVYAVSYVQYGNTEQGKKYLQPIEESMHYYFQVNYKINNNISLYFSNDGNNQISEYYVRQEEPIVLNVYADISQLNDEEKAAFQSESNQCKLNVFNQSSPFEVVGETLLKATFNLSFDSIEDYNIYAYTDRITTDNTIIPTSYTANIIVYVSGDIQPSINNEIIQAVYPGKVKYTVSLEGVKNDSMNGEVYFYKNEENKGTPTVFTFDRFIKQYERTISAINAGSYTIDFEANNQTRSTNFIIEQATITPTISDETNKGILGIPTQQASIILSSNGNSIENLNENHISIQTKSKNNDDSYKERPIKKIILGPNNNMTVFFEIQTYTADTWNVNVQINNNNNYKALAQSSTKEFTTFLHTPNYDDFTIEENDNNDITITIKNPYTEYIPLFVELSEKDRQTGTYVNKLKYICITDSNGQVSIPRVGDKTLWNNRKYISISINPTHEELINALLDEEEVNAYDDTISVVYGPQNISEEYDPQDFVAELFMSMDIIVGDEVPDDEGDDETNDEPIEDPNVSTLTIEEIILEGLRNQLINNESAYLFTYYGEGTTAYIRQ